MSHSYYFMEELISCTGCGFCKKSYFSYEFCKKESDYPKGKLMISYGLLNGEIEEDENVVKILQKCTLCKRCEKDCPSLIKIADVIKEARSRLKNLLPQHEIFLKNYEKYDNIFGEKNFYKEGNEMTFFMGCITNKEMKDIVVSLFDKLGIDIRIVGGCCGYPIEKIGRKTKIKINKRKLDERMILSCPNGMLSFKNSLHISQFILNKKIEFKKKNRRYIYHDSSFLGRYLNIYEEPRKVISKIGKLIEFKENRDMARQCGGEIEFRTVFPEEAEEMAKYLVKEAKEKNAIIVTSSPHCYSHLKEYGAIDLLQLIEENVRC